MTPKHKKDPITNAQAIDYLLDAARAAVQDATTAAARSDLETVYQGLEKVLRLAGAIRSILDEGRLQ